MLSHLKFIDFYINGVFLFQNCSKRTILYIKRDWIGRMSLLRFLNKVKGDVCQHVETPKG